MGFKTENKAPKRTKKVFKKSSIFIKIQIGNKDK